LLLLLLLLFSFDAIAENNRYALIPLIYLRVLDMIN